MPGSRSLESEKVPMLLIVAAFVLVAQGLAAAGQEEASEATDLAATAKAYVERFLAGEHGQNHDAMSERMRSAFPPARAEQVRSGLLAKNGAVGAIGDAWMEDTVEGFTRYRVPTEFEKDTLDFRVVFDAGGKVAGFFYVPHVPSPTERAADPSSRSEPRPEYEGHWEGTIQIPGQELGVLVDLEHEDGYWLGTIDIPAQGAEGLPLDGIRIGEDGISFAIADVPGAPKFDGKIAGGEITGTFTQGGQAFPFRLGRNEIEKPKRPQEPEPPFPYTERDVSYENGEIRIAGTLTLPRGEGPFPAALLISGSGPQNRDEEVFGHRPFLVLADHLTRAGIAVLRVDDRGVGESTGDRSGATSDDYAEDARAGVRFLSRQREIDAGRIGLIGHSEGGIIAPIVASRSEGVAFVVLLAGSGVPGDAVLVRQLELISRASGMGDEQVARTKAAQRELLEAVRTGAPTDRVETGLRKLIAAQTGADEASETVDEAVAGRIENLTSPWFRFFLRHDPAPTLRKVRVPVLALCGERDLQVDPAQNLPAIRKALEKGGNPDFTVEELAGLNHLFQKSETGSPAEYYAIEETINVAALDAIREWILERFGPRSADPPATPGAGLTPGSRPRTASGRG